MGKASSCTVKMSIIFWSLVLIMVVSLELLRDENDLKFKSLDGGSTSREGAVLMLEIPADQGNAPFNQANWLYGTEQEKAEEIKKLIKQRLLEDKSMEELKQLLRAGGKWKPCYSNEKNEYASCAFSTGSGRYDLIIEVKKNAPNQVYFRSIS